MWDSYSRLQSNHRGEKKLRFSCQWNLRTVAWYWKGDGFHSNSLSRGQDSLHSTLATKPPGSRDSGVETGAGRLASGFLFLVAGPPFSITSRAQMHVHKEVLSIVRAASCLRALNEKWLSTAEWHSEGCAQGHSQALPSIPSVCPDSPLIPVKLHKCLHSSHKNRQKTESPNAVFSLSHTRHLNGKKTPPLLNLEKAINIFISYLSTKKWRITEKNSVTDFHLIHICPKLRIWFCIIEDISVKHIYVRHVSDRVNLS